MITFETSHLCKSYGSKKILDDLNISIREGEIYGLVGRNGAGKTTLIKILLGLAKPTSGTIKINGVETPDGLAYERSKIGAIIDSPSFLYNLTAFENVKSMQIQLGKFDPKEIDELLYKVGLNPQDNLKVKNFSLGMKQRLAIAIALIGKPSILVLDEPVNGLDPTGIFEVRELLERLNHEDKITIVISSHLLAELEKLANSYGVIEKGHLVKEMRGSDLAELCKPYIKVAVEDFKSAMHVMLEHYHTEDFDILPYDTLAIYNAPGGIPEVVEVFSKNNIKITNITHCKGDLESTFINLMGGLSNEEKSNIK